MPELPDAEVFRRRVATDGLGRTIASVEVDDADLLHGRTVADLRDALVGAAFTDTHRHGKWCLVAVDSAGWLALHHGMTGFTVVDVDELPDHARLVVAFEDGGNLVWDCQRRFGAIEFPPSPSDLVGAHELGPDARRLNRDGLDDVLAGRRGGLKSLLMDQSAIAGLGNVYTDEVLFNARIHPETAVADLGDRAVGRLHTQLHRVLDMAVERDADPSSFPRTWLTRHRDDAKDCPRCGAALRRTSVNQRTTVWCPRHQPEP